MKKRIVCVLICICALMLSACQKGVKDTHNHDHENETEVKIHLRVGLSAHEDEAHHIAAKQFAQQVEQRSGGTVKATIYGDGQLGTDAELIDYLAQDANKVDIVISDVSNFTKLEPCMDISALPFVFEDYEDAWKFMDGEIQAEAERSLLENNIRVLAHYTNGLHCLTTTRRVVSEASDLCNLSIGANAESYGTIAMRAMEARVSVLESNEIMQALQQGRCDGYMGRLEDIYNGRIYQKQAHLMMTNHSYEGVAFAIADSVWNSLENEEREIIKAAALDSAYADRQLVQQQTRDMLDKMEAAGVHIHYPKHSTFLEKVEPVIRGYSSQYGSLVEKVILYKKQ